MAHVSARFLLLFFLVTLAASQAMAVPGTFTWTGAGGDNLWTNPNNWDGVPAITFEPNGFPNASDHTVSIGLGAGTILIGTTDSVSCFRLDQTAGTLNVLGRLKIYGNYNLNFPSLPTANGSLTLAGNTITGLGTSFGSQVPVGSLLFQSDNTLIGYVASAPSATGATLVQMAGLNPSPIPNPTTFLYVVPTTLNVLGSVINTNVSGELANVVTGGPFTDDMRGRMLFVGSQPIGVVMSFESSSRIRLTSAALSTVTGSGYSITFPVAESGTGALTTGANSRISFVGNVSQNIPTRTYNDLFIEDSRTSAYTDIFKGAYVSGSDITVTGQLRQRHQVRLSSALGARLVLSSGATHLTWVGDNNTATAWPLATYATTEDNPYSIVYSGLVNRTIINHAASNIYNAVDFSNADTKYNNVTIIGNAASSTVVIPGKSTWVINGNLTIGTQNSYPNSIGFVAGRRLTLGNTSTGGAASDAVTFTLNGNYSKTGGGSIIARDGSTGYNRSRIRINGTGALAQAFFDDIANPSGLRLTELNVNRHGLAANYAGDADTYDLTSGSITLTGTTRACDNIALRTGGATAPVLNYASNTLTVAQIVGVAAGTLASTTAGNNLSVSGIWQQNGGTFSPGTGNVTFTGFFGQTISVDPTASCSFYKWTVNKTFNAVALNAGIVTIINELSLPSGNNGTLQVAGTGNVILQSNASGTARVTQVGGGAITGSAFTVQRYLADRTGSTAYWILLGPPVTDGAAQDFIGLNATTTPANTVKTYTYNETDTTSFLFNSVKYNYNGWKQLTSLANTLPNGKGFRAWASTTLLQGSRTYSVTGTLATGNVNVNLTRTTSAPGGYDGGGWNLLANPYACPIDFNSGSLVKPANMNNAFWTWDGQNSRYQVFVGASGTDLGSVALNISGNPNANLIAQGQAFFVKLTSGTTATFGFREAAKVNQDATFYRTEDGREGYLRLTLTSPKGVTDEAAIRFSPRATLGYDDFADAYKLASGNVDIAVQPQPGLDLSVNTQPVPSSTQVLPLHVKSAATGSHSFLFEGLAAMPDTLEAYLQDLHTGSSTKIEEGTRYTTDLAAADLLQPDTRFLLLLKRKGALAGLTLTVYPNPAAGQAWLHMAPLQAASILSVRDVSGRAAITQTLPLGTERLPISVASLVPGIYTVTVSGSAGTLHQKLVIE